MNWDTGPLGQAFGSGIPLAALCCGDGRCYAARNEGPFCRAVFTALTVFPIIGVSKCSEVLKKVPWGAMIAICMLPLLGVMITGSGMSEYCRRIGSMNNYNV